MRDDAADADSLVDVADQALYRGQRTGSGQSGSDGLGMMRFDVFSLMPDVLEPYLKASVLGRAME